MGESRPFMSVRMWWQTAVESVASQNCGLALPSSSSCGMSPWQDVGMFPSPKKGPTSSTGGLLGAGSSAALATPAASREKATRTPATTFRRRACTGVLLIVLPRGGGAGGAGVSCVRGGLVGTSFVVLRPVPAGRGPRIWDVRAVAQVSPRGQATRRAMREDGGVPRTAHVLVTALSAVLALSACTGSSAVDVDRAGTPQLEVVDPGPTGVFRVADRQASPRIAGETLDGAQLDVADLRGKVVVVNFWASWCAPCRAEAPNLKAVAERRAAEGVAFVGVAVKDDADAARAFERTQQVPYPSLFDQAGVVLTRFRALAPQTPPSTLLLDRQGRIAGRFIGGVTETELDGPVQALLGEPA